MLMSSLHIYVLLVTFSHISHQDEYDTFATGQAEKARKQAELESKSHASLIPGPVIKEFIQPVPTSIGVTLLKKMGWRQGKGLAAVNPAEMQSSLWGPEAMLLSQNVEIHVLKPKVSTYLDNDWNSEILRCQMLSIAIQWCFHSRSTKRITFVPYHAV